MSRGPAYAHRGRSTTTAGRGRWWQDSRWLHAAYVVGLAVEVLALIALLITRCGPVDTAQVCRLAGSLTVVRDGITYVHGAETHLGEIHDGTCTEAPR